MNNNFRKQFDLPSLAWMDEYYGDNTKKMREAFIGLRASIYQTYVKERKRN